MKHFNIYQYDNYKESGTKWLGNVPEQWRLVRNKEIFFERGSLSQSGKETLLTVSHITGVTRRSEKNVNMFMAETMEGYKHCKTGDLIINTMWAWMGALGTAKEDGICSPAYGVYAPRKNMPYSHRYFDYLFRTTKAVSEMTRNSKGIVSSRLRLYPKDFFQITIALPSYCEQTSISAYLDTTTAQIEKKIELLDKKAMHYVRLKQSLVNKTVTHGLDKSIPMKDSGVAWIGDIPENWKIYRIKDIAVSINGGAFKDDLVDFGLPIIKIQQLTLNSEASDFCDPLSLKLKRGNLIKDGDLLFSWSTLIAPFIYRGKDAVLNQHIFKITHSHRTNKGWLFYKLSQSVPRLTTFAHGSTMQHILKSDFDNLEIETPPLSEQIAIANYLNEKAAKIDQIVTTIKMQIEKLKALRKTLINDVVTGKIKVTNEGLAA